jgi:uncharacterized membrane protein YwaF
MKGYQLYFAVLKLIVFAQVVLVLLGFQVDDSPLFAFVDMLFKLSLGLFLGIYFWLFTPKGIDWEDGLIISIGGFLILADIHFTPLVQFYELRDKTMAKLVSLKDAVKTDA